MKNPQYYAKIPARVRYDESLTPMEKLLYGEVAVLCLSTGTCWAGNKYFADLYGVSQRTVSRCLAHLARKGYLELSGKTSARVIRVAPSDKIDRSLETKVSDRRIEQRTDQEPLTQWRLL